MPPRARNNGALTRLLTNSPLLADMLVADVRDHADQIDAEANGSRQAAPRVKMLRQFAYAVEDEYGSTDDEQSPPPPEQHAAPLAPPED